MYSVDINYPIHFLVQHINQILGGFLCISNWPHKSKASKHHILWSGYFIIGHKFPHTICWKYPLNTDRRHCHSVSIIQLLGMNYPYPKTHCHCSLNPSWGHQRIIDCIYKVLLFIVIYQYVLKTWTSSDKLSPFGIFFRALFYKKLKNNCICIYMWPMAMGGNTYHQKSHEKDTCVQL